MKNITLAIIAITLIATAIVGYILAQKFMRDMAIDGCYQTGRATITTDDDREVIIPDGYWFEACIKNKGYEGITVEMQNNDNDNK